MGTPRPERSAPFSFPAQRLKSETSETLSKDKKRASPEGSANPPRKGAASSKASVRGAGEQSAGHRGRMTCEGGVGKEGP